MHEALVAGKNGNGVVVDLVFVLHGRRVIVIEVKHAIFLTAVTKIIGVVSVAQMYVVHEKRVIVIVVARAGFHMVIIQMVEAKLNALIIAKLIRQVNVNLVIPVAFSMSKLEH